MVKFLVLGTASFLLTFSGFGCGFLLSDFLLPAFCFCSYVSDFCLALCSLLAFCFLLSGCCFLLVAVIFFLMLFASCFLLPAICCFLLFALCFSSAAFIFLLLVDYALLPSHCFQPFWCLLPPFCSLFAEVLLLALGGSGGVAILVTVVAFGPSNFLGHIQERK